jgi:tetratricopeptide (TPR) repeat protein
MYAYKYLRNLLLIYTLFAFVIPTCYAEDVNDELTLPGGKVVYHEYEDTELIKIADLLYQFHRHPEAVEACQEAIYRHSLSNAQTASIKHLLAKSYEAIPGHGQDAKDTYSGIIQAHTTYEKIPEIAYRLGELNTCIIPEDTEPDSTKAIESLRLVITRLPIESTEEIKVTYLSLKAHMMLGNIYMDEGLNDTARRYFKTIYDCDINKASSLPYKEFETEEEMQKHIEKIKMRITNMKKRIPVKLVSSCIYPDIGQSMQKLSELQSEYADDTEISEIVSEELRKLNDLEDIIEQEISDPNVD